MKNNLTIPVAIIVAAVIIGGAVILTKNNGTDSGSKTKKETGSNISIRPVSEDDHILGNPDAEIKLVEFSDTECPYCKVFHGTMNQIANEYGKDGKVAWVYRHLPLDSLHSRARKEAEATECARELGGNTKFWEYINNLYSVTPSNNNLNPNELPNIAESIGLDRVQFEECLSSERNASKVEEDAQEAIANGGNGTPFTIIIDKNGNQIPFSGAYPYFEADTRFFDSLPVYEQEIFCDENKACGIKVMIENLLAK
ncbi:MAG: DsbA family protein [Patescibacteria group bacterium]|nr:DsbA family protein [Patescibacteria group bacterium]